MQETEVTEEPSKQYLAYNRHITALFQVFSGMFVGTAVEISDLATYTAVCLWFMVEY